MTFPMMPLQAYFAIWWNSSLSAEIALEKTLKGEQEWSPLLKERAEALQAQMLKQDKSVLARSLRQYMSQEWQLLCDGAIVACQAEKTMPEGEEKHVIWQKNSARLVDYDPQGGGYPILVIPSLINRSYILDLHPDSSYLRYLVAQGYRPFVMEWQTPSVQEQDFKPEDYVTQYLEEALLVVQEHSVQTPFVLGYCMGGVLALGLAMRFPSAVKGLILCAIPWCFHSDKQTRIALSQEEEKRLQILLQRQSVVPAAMVQAMFYWLYPDMVRQKLKKLALLGKSADGTTLAMERWVNDGIGLTRGCAESFWISWLQQNQLAKNAWKIGETFISPEKLDSDIPVMISMPKKDKIVPMASSQPLVKKLQARKEAQLEVSYPDTGHIGMMVGSRAEKEFWQPSVQWMASHRH